MKNEDYLIYNKESWNARTEHHFNSGFYEVDAFKQGKNMLNSIELDLLGDIKGKSVLHLQCHFGQDTLSLARLGAKVTGVDFSEEAIKKAKQLNDDLKLDARFICCDVYTLPQHLNELFDIVFTSYGVIGWLPDMDKWAGVISHFLKPGGKFVMAEFHPVVWMFDNDFSKVEYNYFKADAIVETENGTYADKSAPIKTTTISWNHGLAEVLEALLKNGLRLNKFQEFDYSPYPCFNHVVETEPGKWHIKHIGNRIPMVYALVAEKL
ncbi:MAG: class I SAM-dependent methyltransferase [Bacteroidia bacterium]|nr:class I SAM-dependent methyltransferase [Bacteroidia bacterium]